MIVNQLLNAVAHADGTVDITGIGADTDGEVVTFLIADGGRDKVTELRIITDTGEDAAGPCLVADLTVQRPVTRTDEEELNTIEIVVLKGSFEEMERQLPQALGDFRSHHGSLIGETVEDRSFMCGDMATANDKDFHVTDTDGDGQKIESHKRIDV